MKKILFCASTLSHIKNFHLPYIEEMSKKGWKVDVVANQKIEIDHVNKSIELSFKKQIFSISNMKDIIKIRKIIKQERYDVISVHTTLAAAVIRLSTFFLPNSPKIIYTCHGYLFEKNKFIKNLFLLGIEKLCALKTDILVVMNKEDLNIGKKYKLYKLDIKFINGMGINKNRFQCVSDEEKNKLKVERGFTKEDKLFIYVAEFSKRKNHNLLIRAFKNIESKIPNAKLLLVGNGDLIDLMKGLVKKLDLEEKVIFLGYVNNISELYKMCDICVSSSLIEGLPFNVMEAMASGLPVIASNIKGHKELVENDENGYLYNLECIEELQNQMLLLYTDPKKMKEFGKRGLNKIKEFDIDKVLEENIEIYELFNRIEKEIIASNY